MISSHFARGVALPKGWTRYVRSALLQAMSLAATAWTLTRSRVATSRRQGDRVQAELARTHTEIALLNEELRIKDARWNRLPSRRRPHYTAIERLRILELKAARGWSREQVARIFLLDEQTVRSWVGRVDEEGAGALVRMTEPVNKFPEFVRYLVKELKALVPAMGKVRIAQVLARAGLHLGATTVGRILKETEPVPEAGAGVGEVFGLVETGVVTARRPDEIWHVDLTTVPTAAGFWVPWLPFTWPQAWPFCWWVAVVIDHFSRAVVGFAVFSRPPTSVEVQRSLALATRRAGRRPKYVISDQGRQFRCKSFRRWCRRQGIRPRFGAIGEYGSLAIIERFMRPLKAECTRQMLVPIRLDAMRREIASYVVWHNQYRPSQALSGQTPWEVAAGLPPANAAPRFEPRASWPTEAACAGPQTVINGRCGTKLALVVGHLAGRRHLPVIELREAA